MATTAPPAYDEARELRLVNNVEMKIAFANTPEQLESLLEKFLCPVLWKLDSPSAKVREKVASIVIHISDRVRPTTIKLPIEQLLKQYNDPNIGGKSAAIRRVDMIFINMGIERADVNDRISLAPQFLKGISSREEEHQKVMLTIFVKHILPHMKIPTRASLESSELRKTYGFEDHPEDAKWVAHWLGLFLLLNMSYWIPRAQSGDGSQPVREMNSPGLSEQEFKFLNSAGEETFKPFSILGGLKNKAMGFLASGVFTEEEVFMAALCGIYDTPTECSSVAEQTFKLSFKPEYLERETYVERLYELYLGDKDTKRAPASVLLQRRILSLLERSKLAVHNKYTAKVMKVVESELLEKDVKPRRELFSFVSWFARMASNDAIDEGGLPLVDSVWQYISGEGQDNSTSTGSVAEMELKKTAWQIYGQLLARVPQEIISSIGEGGNILERMFHALDSERSTNVATAIEDALNTPLPALAKEIRYKFEQHRRVNADGGTLAFSENKNIADLAKALQKQITGYDTDRGRVIPSPKSRLVALRYTNRLFPYGTSSARILNLYCLSSMRNDLKLREEAEQGLSPYGYRMMNPEDFYKAPRSEDGMQLDENVHSESIEHPFYAFPRFEGVVHAIKDGFLSISEEENVQSIALPVYQITMQFLRRTLIMNALESAGKANLLPVDESWENKMDLAMEVNEDIRQAFTTYLRDFGGSRIDNFNAYFHLLFLGMAYKGGMTELLECSRIAVEMFSLAPKNVVNFLMKNFPVEYHKSHPIASTNTIIRINSAHLAGLMLTHEQTATELTKTYIQTGFDNFKAWKESTSGMSSNQCHGSILALCYMLSRAAYQKREDLCPKEVVASTFKILSECLAETRNMLLLEASIQGLTELFNFGLSKDLDKDVSKAIQDKLQSLASASVPNEKAIKALGAFSMGFDEEKDEDKISLDSLVETLFKLHESKSMELHFSVAEALSVVAGGWGSTVLNRYKDIQGMEPAVVRRDVMLRQVVEGTLEHAENPKPAMKRASSIWLLGLLEYCGHLQPVQERLERFHLAFRGFLSDRDEFVRETASRGLSMVYECGDADLKEDLVRNLISSFTGEKPTSAAGQITADTELFEPGALPTGEGSISTYGDIMSLASEVGDPSLVYKFMALAKHNSIWSTRAAFGGRYGLGTILASSNVAENPKLYPKLYRYRFDPNSNVRRSMNDIWSAIVKDSNATIEKYFDEIMSDLLTSILDREWRVREASCAAIADIIQGRKFEKYSPYLSKIWSLTFKVLDDIKGSVRAAAMKLCRVLTKSTVHYVDSSSGASPKNAKIILENLMPFLLGIQGIEAKAEEVQAFAFDTLMQLIKKAGPSLKEFIPELVPKLLGLLSTLEPQAINYLHLNADKYNLTEEKIDAVRLSSVRSSPMMEAIERCLDLLDEESMASLMPHLNSTIRKAIGMPSKVGSSRALITLVMRHTFLTKPYGNELLKTVRAVLLDRNDTVSASNAAAAGYLCRIADDKAVLALVEQAKTLYFEHEDDKARMLSGTVVYAISKHAPDRFSALASSILPFVFLAKNDSSSLVNDDFTKCWNDNTGGSGAIKLYLSEIVELATQHIASPKWSVKQASAKTLSSASVAIGADIQPSQIETLYPALVTAVGGKSWDGKEIVLEGFSKFIVTSKDIFAKDPKRHAEVKKILKREAARNNIVYATSAMKSLGRVAAAFEDPEWWELVSDLVLTKLEEFGEEPDEDEMDIDSHSGGPTKSAKIKRQLMYLSCLYALASSLPQNNPDKKDVATVLSFLKHSPPSGIAENNDAEWHKGLVDVLGILGDRCAKWDKPEKEGLRQVAEELQKRTVLGGVKESCKKVVEKAKV